MNRVALLLLVGASGCLPYAYVLPPIDVSADVAPRVQGPTVQPQVTLDFGVRPLALVPEMFLRQNDFSLGYSLMVLPKPIAHGPYADFSHSFWMSQLDANRLLRLRAGVVAKLLYETVLEKFGAQGLARVVFEFAKHVESDFTTSSADGWSVGHFFGEADIGVYAEGGVLALPSGLGWSVGGGIIVTLPASVGVGFVFWR